MENLKNDLVAAVEKNKVYDDLMVVVAKNKGYDVEMVNDVVNEFFHLLGNNVKKGKRIEIENFGVFCRRQRLSMVGEECKKAFWAPNFIPDDLLKEEIEGFNFSEYVAAKKSGKLKDDIELGK